MHKFILAAIAVVLVAIAAVGGYWFGAQRSAPVAAGGTVAGAPGADKGGGGVPPVTVEATSVAVEGMPGAPARTPSGPKINKRLTPIRRLSHWPQAARWRAPVLR